MIESCGADFRQRAPDAHSRPMSRGSATEKSGQTYDGFFADQRDLDRRTVFHDCEVGNYRVEGKIHIAYHIAMLVDDFVERELHNANVGQQVVCIDVE